MQIKSITIGKLVIRLTRPFITAIRQANYIEDIIIQIKTKCGRIGYGSAAATPLITGESLDSIISIVRNNIAPQLIGKDLTEFNQLLQINQYAVQNNTSAKAAISIALHDLFAQKCNLPLYQLLGGKNKHIYSCITISLKDKAEMAEDAKTFVNQGFTTLKIKLGSGSIVDDFERLKTIRNIVGENINLVVDANQGWNPKSALQIIKNLEKLNIIFVEQPVKANDLNGLKFIHERVNTPIFADESCFIAEDILNITHLNACSGINIKLMKCGGLEHALAIYNIAKAANMQIMVGCMLESPIGVAAMASFASSKPDIHFADLDPIALIGDNPIIGGAVKLGNKITLSDKPGLGIEGFNHGFELICEIENVS